MALFSAYNNPRFSEMHSGIRKVRPVSKLRRWLEALEQQGGSYADFYPQEYAQYGVGSRLIGGQHPVDLFHIRQPPGHYPDAAVAQCVLQFNICNRVNALVDVGLGTRSVFMCRGGISIAPPDTAVDYQSLTALDFICFGLPQSYTDTAAEHFRIGKFSVEPLIGNTVEYPILNRLIQDIWKEARRDVSKGALFIGCEPELRR